MAAAACAGGGAAGATAPRGPRAAPEPGSNPPRRRPPAPGGLGRRLRRRDSFGYAAAKLKIESPEFTATDIQGFLGEFQERERELLVERFEAARARLEALRPRLLALADGDAGGDAGWTAREIVAHLALVSKLYGVLAHRVASGKETAYDLLGIVQLRDVAGEQAAQQPVADHLEAIAANQARTLEFLRSASIEALERDAETGIEGLKMRAIDIVRLPLVSHFEQHLEQLETALA